MNYLLILVSISAMISCYDTASEYTPKTTNKPENKALDPIYSKHQAQAQARRKLSLFPKNTRKFIITEKPTEVNQIPTVRNFVMTKSSLRRKFTITEYPTEINQIIPTTRSFAMTKRSFTTKRPQLSNILTRKPETTIFFYRQPEARSPLMKFKKFVIGSSTPRAENMKTTFINNIKMRQFNNDEISENHDRKYSVNKSNFQDVSKVLTENQYENNNMEKPYAPSNENNSNEETQSDDENSSNEKTSAQYTNNHVSTYLPDNVSNKEPEGQHEENSFENVEDDYYSSNFEKSEGHEHPGQPEELCETSNVESDGQNEYVMNPEQSESQYENTDTVRTDKINNSMETDCEHDIPNTEKSIDQYENDTDQTEDMYQNNKIESAIKHKNIITKSKHSGSNYENKNIEETKDQHENDNMESGGQHQDMKTEKNISKGESASDEKSEDKFEISMMTPPPELETGDENSFKNAEDDYYISNHEKPEGHYESEDPGQPEELHETSNVESNGRNEEVINPEISESQYKNTDTVRTDEVNNSVETVGEHGSTENSQDQYENDRNQNEDVYQNNKMESASKHENIITKSEHSGRNYKNKNIGETKSQHDNNNMESGGQHEDMKTEKNIREGENASDEKCEDKHEINMMSPRPEPVTGDENSILDLNISKIQNEDSKNKTIDIINTEFNKTVNFKNDNLYKDDVITESNISISELFQTTTTEAYVVENKLYTNGIQEPRTSTTEMPKEKFNGITNDEITPEHPTNTPAELSHRSKRKGVDSVIIIAPSYSSEEEDDYSEFIFLKAMLSKLKTTVGPRQDDIPNTTEAIRSSDFSLAQRRQKREINIIEEENLGTTVSGFKFTGKEPQLFSNVAFSNINT